MVFSRLKGEAVDVDTEIRLAFKVLVGLNVVEVDVITGSKAVLTIEADLGL